MTEIQQALKDLRAALGITQQDLAVRLGKAVTTIARWETMRPPRGRELAGVARFAAEAGQHEYAQRFYAALAEELGTPDLGFQLRPEPQTPAETAWVMALLHALRVPKHAAVVLKLARLLRAPLEDAAALGQRNLANLEEFQRLLDQANRWAEERRAEEKKS